jgi:hypothetical protein
MAFSFSNLFKPKVTIEPSLVLNQIDYKEGTKFAENSTHKVYIDVEELGGFPYLKTVIFGVGEIKIKRHGCTITFIFEDEKITLISDNTDIGSQELSKTGIFHTPIDFELDETEAEKIQKNKILEAIYTFKKNTLSFKPN